LRKLCIPESIFEVNIQTDPSYIAQVILLSPENIELNQTQKNSLIPNIRRDIDENVTLEIKTISYSK